ncbi:septum site-determining protein MinD [Halobacteriales archaeon QH_10_67_22]|nr:MAG: septum site-determining protein MinD [Halobacteriales archaeon QH_10_67_22]
MAGYVCTVAGGKGGVGKTTTAVNVAAALEGEGYDVVVVDADLGMANLAAMLGVDPDDSIHEILAGGGAVSDALTEAEGGITIVPGEQSLEAFADADPAKLKRVVKTLRNAYDVVLIDTGAGLSHETTVPLGLADGILLITTPDEVAVGDAVKTAELADRVGGEVLGAMINRATSETDVETIAEKFDSKLLAVIPDDIAATENEPLVFNSPDSHAAEAYRLLTDQLVGVFFEGERLADVETVVESEWFDDVDGTTDDESDDDDDDDDGGFAHSVFQGI